MDEFQVELVTRNEFRPESEAAIKAEFSQRLRAPVKVRVHYSSAIPASKNGKFRYVISEVDAHADKLVHAKH